MALRRSILDRRGRRRLLDRPELPLTSLLDVLVIILIFLLKSYSVSTHNFSTIPGLKMPTTKSPEIPPDSLQVIVTPEGVTFENERIVEFKQSGDSLGHADAVKYELKASDLDEGGRRIGPLFDALVKAREKSEVLRAKSKARDEKGNPLPFQGVLAIQADQRVRYETLRKIMYTAAVAEFRTFRFLALRPE